MSLELVNTLCSLLTVAIIAATAIVALGQLRHLRAGNQITALLSIQDELDGKDYRKSEALLREQLQAALREPAFCEFIVAMSQSHPVIPADERYPKIRQAVIVVGNTFENLGSLVKNEMLDQSLFFDVFSWVVNRTWRNLAGYIAIIRASTGQRSVYENFEYIAALSERYLATQRDSYPKGVARLEMRVPEPAKAFLEKSSP